MRRARVASAVIAVGAVTLGVLLLHRPSPAPATPAVTATVATITVAAVVAMTATPTPATAATPYTGPVTGLPTCVVFAPESTPGTTTATANQPAGGGVYDGQTDQQIQHLFQQQYGDDWQTAWNNQHTAC